MAREKVDQKENPRDLRPAGNRSSQPPSAPRALVPQATSAFFARLPDRRRRSTSRRTSAFAVDGHLAVPASRGPPGRIALRRSVRGRRLRPRGRLRRWGPVRVLADPPGSRSVRFTFRCPGRSSGPLASITSTAWSEANHIGAPSRRSTSRFRRSDTECAGRCPGTNSDKRKAVQRSRCRRRSAAADEDAKPSRVTDITTRSTQAPPFHDRSGRRPSTTKPHFP